MTSSLAALVDATIPPPPCTSNPDALPREADELCFAVREPFTSRTSRASLVFGKLSARQALVLRSYRPENGETFSAGT